MDSRSIIKTLYRNVNTKRNIITPFVFSATLIKYLTRRLLVGSLLQVAGWV